MPDQNRVHFFPVDNGDTTLIEAGGRTIVTDINYRQFAADSNSDHYDFLPMLRSSCERLNGDLATDVFVLTHPDQDHLGGFTDVFHVGSPSQQPADAESRKIRIDELWVSSHSTSPNYETDASKPVFREIRRRLQLQGKAEGGLDGNRIQILEVGSNESGSISDTLHWHLLAPTADEAAIEPSGDPNSPSSTNNSSLVLLWRIVVDGGTNSFLLGGDAGVEVWERIWFQFENDPAALARHVLLAPHHCSMTAFGIKDLKSGEYDVSFRATAMFSQMLGDGFIVASSKPIRDDDDNPPHYQARRRYLEILTARSAADAESRFLNPATHKGGDPAPVVFELTATGPSRKPPEKISGAPAVITTGFSKPSDYGFGRGHATD